MEKEQNLKLKMVRSILGVILSGVMLLATGYSFGWFSSNQRVTGSGMGVGVGFDPAPDLIVFTYNTAKEDGTEDWTESPVSGYDTYSPVINDFNKIEGGKFVIPSLPLGTVDNLVNPKDDNTMFLRFTIRPKSVGDSFSLTIMHMDSSTKDGETVYPFQIYDKNDQLIPKTKIDENGDEVDNDVYDKIRSVVEDGNLRLFKLQYFIDNASKPSGIETTPSEVTEEDGTLIQTVAKSTDPYYLYVKVQPNPNTFAYIAKFLYRYMPCVFLYNFYIEYDLTYSQS